MTILVGLLVLMGEPDRYASGSANFIEHRIKFLADQVEGHFGRERKVQVLRKPVIAKVASLESRPALEGQPLP